MKIHQLRDPRRFYDGCRKVMGKLDQTQVDTIERLLREACHWPATWLAYGLATAWHECRMRPITEWGNRAYFRKYDIGRLARALGNTPQEDGDGFKYRGRGLVQLTGYANYKNAGRELNLDLVGNPDLALRPDVAARILVWGMENGEFTGKALKDYITRGNYREYVNARRIINGTDRASQIARYAEQFEAALDAGEWLCSDG